LIDQVEGKREAGTSTLDLALRIVEFLAFQSQPLALAQIARQLSASKATVYRHLVTLQKHRFVRRDSTTGRYEAGVKLIVLGEAQRNRFGILTRSHTDLICLRDQTGQAATLCKLLDDEPAVLEIVQSRTIIEFGMRPGTRLDFHATAHGKMWLAFGPPCHRERVVSKPLKRWTPQTVISKTLLMRELDIIRERGWSTAPDQVLTGVNALAAPVFDHRGELAGSVAIVGSTQFIPAVPNDAQIAEVAQCASRISHDLGWRAGP
jgi:DNA-binding IclR family transcriptional regulator